MASAKVSCMLVTILASQPDKPNDKLKDGKSELNEAAPSNALAMLAPLLTSLLSMRLVFHWVRSNQNI